MKKKIFMYASGGKLTLLINILLNKILLNTICKIFRLKRYPKDGAGRKFSINLPFEPFYH